MKKTLGLFLSHLATFALGYAALYAQHVNQILPMVASDSHASIQRIETLSAIAEGYRSGEPVATTRPADTFENALINIANDDISNGRFTRIEENPTNPEDTSSMLEMPQGYSRADVNFIFTNHAPPGMPALASGESISMLMLAILGGHHPESFFASPSVPVFMATRSLNQSHKNRMTLIQQIVNPFPMWPAFMSHIPTTMIPQPQLP